MMDKPGALAMLTQKLAEMHIDIVATRCAAISRGESGNCTVIVDVSKAKASIEDVKRALEELDVVTLVRIRSFEAFTQ